MTDMHDIVTGIKIALRRDFEKIMDNNSFET